MGIKHESKDRYAVNTVVAVLIIVIIVAAGVGAYALLSGNESDIETKNTRSLAPGTMGTYEVNASGDSGGDSITMGLTITFEIVAQNSDRYLIEYRSVSAVDTDLDETYHDFVSKTTGAPVDAKKIGTSKVSTLYGDKNLEIWEYYEDGVPNKDYIDHESKIVYRSTSTMGGLQLTADLKSLSISWQDSYEQSSSIGNNLRYGVAVVEGDIGYVGTSVTELVAESPSGYWQKVTVSLSGMPTEISYSLVSDGSADQTYTGNADISTIHGPKTVKKWTWVDNGNTYLSFVDPDNGLTYRMEIQGPDTVIVMELEGVNSDRSEHEGVS